MIPTDWKLVKLQDTSLTIIDGDRGNNYPKSDDFTADGFCLFLSAKNITKNGFRLNEKQFISEEKDNLLRKGKLKDLDIIITTRGSVGHIAYNENIPFNNIRINSGMVILRNNDNSINQKYIYKLFASNVIQRQIEKIAFGSAQPQLTVKEINNLKIPLPPLKEQEKIADILSTADDKIDAIATQIEKAETLKKGLLQKLLSEGIGHSEFKDSELGKIPESWEVVKLDDISELTSSKRVHLSDYVDIGIPFYRGKEITLLKKNETVDDLLYISEEQYNKIKNQFGIPQKNDILITAVGTLANTYRIPNDNPFYFKDGNLIWLKGISENSIFIDYTLGFYKKQILDSAIGSSQKALTIKELKKIKIPLLPREEQKQIVNILSTADKKLEVLRAKKEKYEILKKGLMQKLLSGEVRV